MMQIVSILGLGKPGPVVGKLTAAARDWQYSHPAHHPKALQERETQSLPPDALVEHLKDLHQTLTGAA
jgi:fatty acid desaturase